MLALVRAAISLFLLHFRSTPVKRQVVASRSLAPIASTIASAITICVVAMPLRASPSLYMTGGTASGSHDAIYRFTPTGTATTVATGSNTPMGMAIDGNGSLFLADYGDGNIYKYGPDGSKSTFATGLDHPWALAFDPSGNLYEAGDRSYYIYKYSPSGIRSSFAYWYGSNWGLASDQNGNLFMADPGNYQVVKITPQGTRSVLAGVEYPTGVAVDKNGNIFVASDGMAGAGPGIIYKFTPSGGQSTFASGLQGPFGLAFDKSGNLFEADAFSGIIYKFSPTGTRTTFATGLNFPRYLAFGDSVPEPSAISLGNIGVLLFVAWLIVRRQAHGKAMSHIEPKLN